jgi:hypothetical protein
VEHVPLDLSKRRELRAHLNTHVVIHIANI